MKLDPDGTLWFSPTDLNAYIGCAHATTLALAVARGERAGMRQQGAYQRLILRKGLEHEAAYLQRMRDDGRQIVEINEPNRNYAAAAALTADAMRAGAELIYQAAFVYDGWRGLADFLERVDGRTDLGDYGYEAVDTKLARSELMPHHALQLCFYSEGVARVQGTAPEAMHVELGSGRRQTVRLREVAAYHRRVRAAFRRWTAAAPVTEPYPCEHCTFCEFVPVCTAQWRQTDHLHYVAGIRRGHVGRLRDAGVATLTDLAGIPTDLAVPDLANDRLEDLREQARLQRRTIDEAAIAYILRPTDLARGFSLLPQPSPGDVMFDLEGDPFWEADRELTFLFGLLLRDDGEWRYDPVWAHDEAQEKRAFELVMDRLTARLVRYPDMHVYVYSHAEATGLKELMAKHATREEEVDALLRRAVIVDLLQVVRQGLRAGLEGYSLKQVEHLAGYVRRTDLESGAGAVVGYENWRDTGDSHELQRIGDYNEDDCRATLALRDWLLSVRPAAATWLEPVASKEPSEEARAALDARASLRAELVDGSEPGSARWLAGELLEYHRREARPQWWQWFAWLTMNDADLIADAEAIGGLRPDESVPLVPVKQSLLHTLRFPEQEHKVGPGSRIDPTTEKDVTVESLDDATGTLRIARGKNRTDPLPRAIVPGDPYNTEVQRQALMRLAQAVRDGSPRFLALQSVLALDLPRFSGRETGGSLQTTDLAEQAALALALDESCLVVQGPPGTGKTYTGARLIVQLLEAGKRVGVTALSHNAIDNLLREVERAADSAGVPIRGARHAGTASYDGRHITNVTKQSDCFDPANSLVAGTTWLFAPEQWDDQVDVLVIDEAGQLSLADALAAGTAARNLILLGDPQQLAQVSQGTHPPGSAHSVLEHMLAGEATIPPERGLFLEHTWRMHPDVCGVISREIYDGRLHSHPDCARQTTTAGTGIRYLPVEHFDNGSRAPQEAERIAAEVERLLDAGRWIDMNGAERALLPGDVMVVSPYNAQVRTLRGALPDGVRVGTVDIFQGQEAPVVFFSMAVSTATDAPRGLDFLFSRNRLNVAISRARCLAYLVCAPALLEAPVRTLDQMRLVSTLCALAEAASAASTR